MKEARGDLGEMRFVTDPERLGDGDVNLAAAILDSDAGEFCIERCNPGPHRGEHLRSSYQRCSGIDVQLGAESVGAGLPDLDARPCPPVVREVRIAGRIERLPVPRDVQRRVDAAKRVRHQRVAVVIEVPVDDRVRESRRKPGSIRDGAEIGF